MWYTVKEGEDGVGVLIKLVERNLQELCAGFSKTGARAEQLLLEIKKKDGQDASHP